MTKRKTHEEFIDEFYNMCQSIDVLGTYKTTDTPIECRCKDCNHVWFPTPNKLLHGRRCPVCANKKRGIHIERKEFIDKLGKANTLVELVGEYEGGAQKNFLQMCEVRNHLGSKSIQFDCGSWLSTLCSHWNLILRTIYY